MERAFDLVCFSHLRWDFVYQRPQHLLSRCARERRVFFIEEPVFDGAEPWMEVQPREAGLHVVVPHLPAGVDVALLDAMQRRLVDLLITDQRISQYVLWYYSPMALVFTDHLTPLAVVYDCMDELSAFRGAPPQMCVRENALLRRADVVFTGGQSLFEAKRDRHPNVHPIPSSVDLLHFAQARTAMAEPDDQAGIGCPRLGFFGVIDERLDIALLDAIAAARPSWHIVMVGPVVKIDQADLPRRTNIHYLGGKAYADLPAYISGWDVALLPFARNESTRFISPTKTPEYLAAGRPVVSTAIRDVVHPYGEWGLVHIADTPDAFVASIERALTEDRALLNRRTDAVLARSSWDATWARMAELVDAAVRDRQCREGTIRSGITALPVASRTLSIGTS